MASLSTLRSVALNERLEIQQNAPPSLAVTLARVSTTATGTTTQAHGFTSGDYVAVNVTVTAYNGKRKVTVLTPTTFTFPCAGTEATPATGTVTYLSDASGGTRDHWRALDTIYAALEAITTSEQLNRDTLYARGDLRFRVYTRDDILPKMRALWTPSYGTNQRTLEIVGRPQLLGDGRIYMLLDMVEAGA